MSDRYVFQVRSADGQERQAYITGPKATVGRLSTADLRVADATASRLHAQIVVQPDGSLVVEDTGGAGGVRVNGRAIERSAIGPGDVIELGRSRLVFERREALDPALESDTSLSEVFEQSQDAKAVREEAARRVAERKSKKPKVSKPKPAEATAAQMPAAAADATATQAMPSTRADSAPAPAGGLRRVIVEPEGPVIVDSASLEVGLRYQGNRIALAHFTEGEVRIGKNFEVPVEGSQYEGRRLFSRSATAGWVVHVPNGEIWRPEHGGGKLTKPEKVPGFFREGDSVGAPIGAKDRGSFTCGPIQLDYRLVPPLRPWPMSWLSQVNFDFVNLLLISLLLHAAAVIFLSLHPPQPRSLEDTLSKTPNRFVRMILQPKPKKMEEPKKAKAKKKAKGDLAKKSAPKGEQLKEDKGKRAAPSKDDIAAAMAAQESLFGASSGTANEVLNAGNNALSAALGSLSAVDPNAGLVGLSDNAAVRQANSAVGLKRIATRGRSSDSSFGKQQRNLGEKKRLTINLGAGGSSVSSTVDKEMVQRIVRSKRSQIKYCYEIELMRTPGLEGKLVMRWVIGKDGRVRSAKAKTEGTTLANEALIQCIVQKIRSWSFEAPKGSGVVRVDWPFLFKEAG